MSETYIIDRGTQGPIQFDGWFLGGAHSHSSGKEFWTEIELFITDNDTYVVHVTGATSDPDKDTRHTVTVYDDGAKLVAGMRHRGKLSALAVKALERAAEVDGEIRAALDDYSTRVTRIS